MSWLECRFGSLPHENRTLQDVRIPSHREFPHFPVSPGWAARERFPKFLLVLFIPGRNSSSQGPFSAGPAEGAVGVGMASLPNHPETFSEE